MEMVLPYQGGALPLSYRSAGAVYALETRDNQWDFQLSDFSVQLAIRARLSGTKREDAGHCGTILTHWRSRVFS